MYEALPADTPLQAGVGYWAFFPVPTSLTLPSAAVDTATIPLPAGHWVMVGNPFDFAAALFTQPVAAVTLITYDTARGRYEPFEPGAFVGLAPGTGVWVYSATGGSLSMEIVAPIIP